MIQTIGIVSLSRGILGEDFLHHELDLGLARLKEFGVRVKFLPHALDGLESLAAHPEHRAQDLLDAGDHGRARGGDAQDLQGKAEA